MNLYRNKFKQTLYTLLLSLLCLTTSCNRKSTSGSGVSSLSAEKTRYEVAVKNVFDYDCLQSKIKLSLKGKSLNGTLRMQAGKRLMLSVNAPLLGFEVGRVEISDDSIMIVDKMDKCYVHESLSALRDKLGNEVNIESLQCLMLGRMYVPGRGVASNSDFKRLSWTTMVDGLLMGDYTQNAAYTLTYTIGTDNFLKSTKLAVAGRDGNVVWGYDDYASFEKVHFAKQSTISAYMEGKTVKGEISMALPTLSQDAWAPFAPTSKYKKVTMPELMEILKKMTGKM